jgi:CRISPR-associated endonuclease Cas2
VPITISYDLKTDDPNQRNYLRSMLERFGWKRLGGSVFRYPAESGQEEDWMNRVIPALMFFRSYILKNNIEIKFFTLDCREWLRRSPPRSLEREGDSPRQKRWRLPAAASVS